MRCGIPNAYILDITMYKMHVSLCILLEGPEDESIRIETCCPNTIKKHNKGLLCLTDTSLCILYILYILTLCCVGPQILQWANDFPQREQRPVCPPRAGRYEKRVKMQSGDTATELPCFTVWVGQHGSHPCRPRVSLHVPGCSCVIKAC